MVQSSGNPTADAILLDGAHRAKLPRPGDITLSAKELQLCLAVPETICTVRESLRHVGTAVIVTAYVPDNMPIITRASRYETYLQNLTQVIYANLRYPPKAQVRGEEGKVIVRMTIRRDGTVIGVQLVQPAPFDSLNMEAINVFNRVSFPPAPDTVDPHAVTLAFQFPIIFSLTAPAKPSASSASMGMK